MNNWDYGGYEKEYSECFEGETHLDGLGRIIVHDIFDEVPMLYKEADIIFVDPPWNIGNVRSFYTKNDLTETPIDNFKAFYTRVFEVIKEVKPRILFIEIGKEYLSDFISECKKQYKYVTFYNSSYYHNSKNKCYVVHATNNFKLSKFKELEDLDEELIIKWICEHIDYDCILDFCLGKGTLAYYSHINNKNYIGGEFNKKRLSVYLKKMDQLNGNIIKHHKLYSKIKIKE